MKKSFTVLLIAIFSVYAGNVFAEHTQVKVRSSHFHVSGQVAADPPCYDCPRPDPSSGSYDESGTVPLSNGMNVGGWDGASAWSSAGFFFVEASTSTGQAMADAYASADWLFRPLAPMDHLTIFAGGDSFFGSGDAFLRDVTDSTDIWSVNWVPNEPQPLEDLIVYSFQTNHVYQLHFSVSMGSTSSYGGLSAIYTNDLIPIVPEPVTLIYLALGLMAVAWVRRKLHK